MTAEHRWSGDQTNGGGTTRGMPHAGDLYQLSLNIETIDDAIWSTDNLADSGIAVFWKRYALLPDDRAKCLFASSIRIRRIPRGADYRGR